MLETEPVGKKIGAGSDERVRFLDGLRGLAAVIVVLAHCFQAYGTLEGNPNQLWWYYGPLSFLTEGESAVFLFFILSGIALPWREFRGKAELFKSTRTTLVWILARTVRIYLPYLMAFGLMACARELFWKPIPVIPPISSWFQFHGGVEVEYNNVMHDLNLFGDYPRILSQGWSLTEEMRFAFLLPVLMPVAVRSSATMFVGLFLAAAFGALSQFVLFFSVGILVAKHWNYLAEVLGHLSPWASLSLLTAGIALFSSRRWFPWYFRDFANAFSGVMNPDYLVVAGATLILVTPLASTGFRRFLESGPVKMLGRISFSLYLVHLAVVFYLSPRLVAEVNAMGMVNPSTVIATVSSLVVVVSCVLATSFYWAVEAPCTALSRRLLAWGARTDGTARS